MSSHPRVGRVLPGLSADPITPAQTARYTGDLLESLRKIALGQGQGLLAHLLGLAAMEAKSLADHAQETRPPG
jgi:hypothetical protein